MKKTFKSMVILLVLALAFSTFSTSMANDSVEASFLVVFKSETLPENAEQVVNEAGGTITYEVPEIGVVEATTTSPTVFLAHMLDSQEVRTVGPSLAVDLNLPEFSVDEESSSTTGHEPVPVEENIWEAGWQWDIEQVTNQFESHSVHTGTHDVVVGVIDTGFDFNHPDLKNNIVPGSKTFVPGTADAWDAHSHGTHVAGTIAANGRVKGVAPDVGVRAYRVFDTGSAQQIWITNAIIAAANDGVDVINMSLGGTRVKGQWFYTDEETGERINLGNDAADIVAYNRAIRYAINKDVTVVSSAGNSGQDLSNPASVTEWYNQNLQESGETQYEVKGATFYVPTQIPGVITVSATGGGFGTDERLAFYSNYGNGAVNLGAPGGDLGPDYPEINEDDYKYLVLSTVPTYLSQSSVAVELFGEGGYGWKGGTSMASPQVAGAAAAYISQVYEETGNKPSPSQVKTALQQTAEDAGKNGYDKYYGHGIVNIYNALTR
ncbi:S8 family serine peptidase [Caldalkalibacillus salinus]|uniref:S8 family serine peptidase n=1 Tax=Caldalkalibacillus salinus TaxID=2803787 RepID=UPI0019229B96|nr:S8 family serine peptidase [Caldalkalibacillus salinus]